MSPESSSAPPPSESSVFSVPSSRVVSPSMTAISEYSNQTSNMTTDSNSVSSVMPSSGTTRSDSTSSLIDGVVQQPHSSTSADVRYANGDSASSTSPSQSQTPDVDPQITEALRSKDRLYVLKLGEVMEGLIREKRGRAELSPSTTYQRLLIHRCSAYYKLTPETDSVTKAISVVFSAESRIPGRRLAELVPLEPTTQPAFKIMRRSQQDRRVKPQSHAGSVTGEDADSSDVEPSETGSMGGRSNATGGSGKKRMTIEERTAAYEQARSRIFMGFEEKEKDMSASSSSGLTSASASHAGSSVGDTEDATSSLATESEWSPNSFNKDSRRSNASSSSRSLRSSSLPYPNGSGNSSRNSRAPSPSFTYPTLYEPHSSPSYDGTHVGSQQSAPAGYQNPPFTYQYPPPSHPPNQPYMAPTYPYYSSYPYGPPPLSQHPQNSSEALPSGDMYSPPPPPPHSMYGTPYMWHPPPNPTPMHSAPPMPTQAPNGQMPGPPPPLQQLPYQPYMQASPYPYTMSGYYTPPPHGPVHSPPSTGGQIYEDPRMMPGPGNNNGHISNNSSQRGNVSQRGMPRGGAMNGGVKRNNAPVPRAAWSYGPGVGLGGVPLNGNNSGSSNGSGETIGPRLSSMRRTSNTSTGSSGHYRPSAPNDDVASTASSSTSSSSRRTYPSTSSQHPLPPRPDWAVGLKPDPTLHATNRHHDHSHSNSRNMSPISPPRALSGVSSSSIRRPHQDQSQPAHLQSNDFPPLSITSPEKRTPTIGGAWTNSSGRSLLMTPPTQSSPSNAALHYPGVGTPNMIVNTNNVLRFEDGFERPPPKAAELYNPKVVKRPASLDNKATNVPIENDKNKGGEAGLTDQMRSMVVSEPSQHESSS